MDYNKSFENKKPYGLNEAERSEKHILKNAINKINDKLNKAFDDSLIDELKTAHIRLSELNDLEKSRREAYDAESKKLHQQFKTSFFIELGIENENETIKTEIFNRAWNDGHASGYQEVINYGYSYSEFFDIIKEALKEESI